MYARAYADYAPRFSMRLFPIPLPVDPEPGLVGASAPDVSAPDLDYSVVENVTYGYGGRAGTRITVGNYSTLGFGYGYDRRESEAQSGDLELQRASVSFSHRLSRTSWLQLAYSYEDGVHGAVDLKTTSHNLSIGVDYQKPLSQSRRTFLRFSTGSMLSESVDERGAADGPDPVDPSAPSTGLRVLAVGSAALVHHMGRTWTAQAQYHRQLRYVDGFDLPIFADTISVGVNGLVSRRLEFTASANYFSGAVSLNPNASRVESYAVAARLRRALTRTLAAYVQYLFYHYAFDEGAARPPGVPPVFDRNALRVGLSLWIPLLD
jgi:hypothetical protein